MKSVMSVWTWPYRKSYYLKRPWKWFQELWWNIRNAHDRATKGYCYLDWSKFDSWFLTIAPKMLRHIADDGVGYPGVEPFETHEKWEEWLHQMADKLERCICPELAADGNNEYEKDFLDMMEKARARTMAELTDDERQYNEVNHISPAINFTEEETALKEKYFNRCRELEEERQKLIKETFAELAEHFTRLWD